MASTLSATFSCLVATVGVIPSCLQWTGGAALCDPLLAGVPGMAENFINFFARCGK